ncbi:MAG: hypothetical protein KF789_06460 [Bdellovibrionaceae bacterium]|nr:hypothetical protein [Pseudobdellovibrionaceae bacterium]
MKNLTNSFLSILIVATALHAKAVPMDPETQTSVIDRLERVISQMSNKEPSWVASNLRLADLLAERARLRFMSEIEKTGKGGAGSEADRKKATDLYESVQNRVSAQEQGRILFQLAHLYEGSGNRKKSLDLFNKILKTPAKYESFLVLKARTGLADIQFQEGKFKAAQDNYEVAMKDSKLENRGLVMYRVAWCQFNRNKLSDGIKTLEKLAGTPSLLTKDSTKGQVYDSGFHGDVVRDLATFYSRRSIGKSDINQFRDLAPTDQMQELLLFFSGEADRLGQKQAAYDILKIYIEDPKLSTEEKLEAYVRMAQARYDMGRSNDSNEDFALAAMTFKQAKCSSKDNKCDELQKRMKRYVTELHRSKKVKPDVAVLKAYFIYVQTFPQDAETAILGAQVALDLKNYPMAGSLYRSASNGTQDAKFLEIALMGEIEAAELQKTAKVREEAYLRYLKVLPNGKSRHEVRYQYAQVTYEQQKHAEAAALFKEIALDTSAPAALRRKSADLSLDSLAIQHRDSDIELWALEFAQAFPKDRAEFQKISRKALMNQVAKTANSKDSSNWEMKKALDKMLATNLSTATSQEKVLHYKNQEVLARKTGNELVVLSSLNGLLAEKTLSASEREEALARKVGLYETRLDFRSAYNTATQMKFASLSKAERELKLGTLADLAEMNANRHYQAALNAGLKGTAGASLRSRMVLSSKNPAAELKKHQNELRKYPNLMAEAVLVIFAKTKSENAVKPFMGSISRTAEARFINKQSFYPTHQSLARRLANQRLNGSSQALMKRTIDQRMKLLAEADSSLVQAVRLNDYTAQIMTLSTVEKENERMVQDLLSLPVPPRLSAAQKAQYTSLLEQQSRPFAQKAQVSRQKLLEFWSNDRALSSLISEYENARNEVKPLLRNELRLLSEFSSGSGQNSRLKSALSEGDGPSRKELLALRQEVSRNPRDVRSIQKLRDLETKIGHPLMATYLDGRLNQIKKEEI